MSGLLSQLFAIEQDYIYDTRKSQEGLRRLLKSKQAGVFVAETAQKVVAMATVQIIVSTAEGGPVGLIEDLVVDREHRGRGIGGRLLKRLQAWSGEQGLMRLQLLADRENRAALDFYQHLGWAPTSLIVFRLQRP